MALTNCLLVRETPNLGTRLLRRISAFRPRPGCFKGLASGFKGKVEDVDEKMDLDLGSSSAFRFEGSGLLYRRCSVQYYRQEKQITAGNLKTPKQHFRTCWRLDINWFRSLPAGYAHMTRCIKTCSYSFIGGSLLLHSNGQGGSMTNSASVTAKLQRCRLSAS